MILRFYTPSRQIRIEVDATDNLHTIITTKLYTTEYTASLSPNYDPPLESNSTIQDLSLKHGNIIYIDSDETPKDPTKKEDNVIKRHQDKYCTHDSNAMCSNCAPLDPWDSKYHSEKKIKYLSYNSYIEMLRKEKIMNDALDYSHKKCSTHDSNVVCGRCQSRAVVLQPQVYRMVDHVEFDNKTVLDYFISFWRGSLKQRVGFLVGKEVDYELVPLGRKVVVSWIYEPEQENFPDGFVIDEDVIDELLDVQNTERETIEDSKIEEGNKSEVLESSSVAEEIRMINERSMNKNINPAYARKSRKCYSKKVEGMKSIQAIKEIIKSLGMSIVGLIYTNLQEEKKEYFISGMEIDFAARIMKKKMFKQDDLEFNSKFVFLSVTKEDNEITLNEYQVSEQGMALISASAIAPTEDPEKMIVTNDSHEIMYRGMNEYNLVANIKAEPFLPIDFFVVRLTHGFKENPVFRSKEYFDWRFNTRKMAKYFEVKDDLEMYSNLNLLVKLKMDNYFGAKFNIFLKSIKDNNESLLAFFKESEEYKNFENSLKTFIISDWECQQCTFINKGVAVVCEMCGISKQ